MKTTRRDLLQNAIGWGIPAGLLGQNMLLAGAGETAARPGPATRLSAASAPAASGLAADGSPVDDWHAELTKRAAALEARGGGTLELGDGVYELARTFRLPVSVSLLMTPNAVLRAKANFQGDAVVVKGGGNLSKYSATAGWIRGGVIDGGRQAITGLRVEKLHRMEIADLSVLDATYKGIHLLKGGNETNITRVRIDVDSNTHYAPGSIGIHFERGDCKVSLAHVIGYETGVRSDMGSNWFHMVHVWNWEPTQGPMKYCFYCNGSCNTFNQCYADSPTVAGFYILKPNQSVVQCSVYYSRWAKDNTGAGFLITSKGRGGTYLGNALFGDKEHRLAKGFDGDLEGACILGNGGWGVVAGMENRIPSGEGAGYSPLNLAGGGLRLTPQAAPPTREQGELGEVRWVDDGKTSALYVKTSGGWKKAELT